jgi:hypothetical protein
MPKYSIATLKTLAKDDGVLFMGADADDRARYAPAIIGRAEAPAGAVAVYDAEAVVELLAEGFAEDCGAGVHDDCDHETEAEEWFSFNTVGGYYAPRQPLFLPRECDEHQMRSNACPCPLSAFDTFWFAREKDAAKPGKGAKRAA